MAAFMPGESPPLVNTAIRFMFSSQSPDLIDFNHKMNPLKGIGTFVHDIGRYVPIDASVSLAATSLQIEKTLSDQKRGSAPSC
jgi:hypothetical protein